MPDHVLRGVPVFLCYPRNPHKSPRLTAFVDYLGETLDTPTAWSIDRLAGSIID